MTNATDAGLMAASEATAADSYSKRFDEVRTIAVVVHGVGDHSQIDIIDEAQRGFNALEPEGKVRVIETPFGFEAGQKALLVEVEDRKHLVVPVVWSGFWTRPAGFSSMMPPMSGLQIFAVSLPALVLLLGDTSSVVVVPLIVSNSPMKEIVVPIGVQLSNILPSATISTEISLKLDDEFRALLKQLSDRRSDEPPNMKPKISWFWDFVILLSIVAFAGGLGGGLKTVVDRRLIKGPIPRLASNVIFGVAAAFLVPIALYSKERKIFELGIQDPLLLLILFSASFAAGLIGAVFIQWFHAIATKMFQAGRH